MKCTIFLSATSCPFGSVTPGGKRARYTAVSAPVRMGCNNARWKHDPTKSQRKGNNELPCRESKKKQHQQK